MFEIFDDYTWTKEKQEIPQHVHGLRELGNITHFNTLSAMEPLPTHYHSDLIEIHCMIKGIRNTTVFEKGSSRSYSINGNETFFILPFELHNNGPQPQKPCEFYAFQINVHDPDHILCLNPQYSRMLYDRLLTMKNRHLRLSSTELSLIRTAFNLLSSKDPDDMSSGLQFLTCFLFNLTYMEPIGKDSSPSVDERIQQALNYVTAHISMPLSVEELAQISGYSPSRFKFKFKKETGLTPSEYVTVQKIETAKKLLETSNVNITELAYNLGFSSSNYFSSVFKKIMGCTPREYRKQFLDFQSSHKKS